MASQVIVVLASDSWLRHLRGFSGFIGKLLVEAGNRGRQLVPPEFIAKQQQVEAAEICFLCITGF